ncbi:MAG: hypothetical protein ACXVYM_02800, partial [Gaiellaceae bacterium]
MICGWPVAAYLLWQTSVPSNLNPPRVKAASLVSARALSEARSFTRVEALLILGSMLTLLAVLAVYAVIGPRFTRESAAGPIGTGMLLGMIGFALVWISQLPFGFLSLWWERRHHLTQVGYLTYAFGDWGALGSQFVFLCLTLLIVMGFGRLIGGWWWLPGALVFVGLVTLSAFVTPYLLSTHRLRDTQLQAEARTLERIE